MWVGPYEVEMRDTIMWVIGIVLALPAAGLMVWNDTDVAPLTVIVVLGITCMAIGALQAADKLPRSVAPQMARSGLED